jgi:hypothetical protein
MRLQQAFRWVKLVCYIWCSILFGALITGCNTALTFFASPTPTPSNTPTLTSTPTFTATASLTPTPTATITPTSTNTPTPSSTPTITPTPTITDTPTVTPTPTYNFPDAEVKMQANCRYGPGLAYMFSAGLYPGDRVIVHNRNWDGTWLWVLPETVDRHCWASSYVLDILDGNVMELYEYYHPLPWTWYVGPAENVQATRDGDQVTITWKATVYKFPYDLRGYLIEARVCQDGVMQRLAFHTDNTTYTITDESGCRGTSSALLYVAEKHGYTDPVQVPWP